MGLDILKKDVIAGKIVIDIMESPLQVDAAEDKSIVNLFEVPLPNVILGQSQSPGINFHGINLSMEKYTDSSEKLTNFIGENRHTEKGYDLNNIFSNEVHPEEKTLLPYISTNIGSMETIQEKGSPDEKKIVEPELLECKDEKTVVQEVYSIRKNPIPKAYEDKSNKVQSGLLDLTLSPVQKVSQDKLPKEYPDVEFLLEVKHDSVRCLNSTQKLQRQCLLDPTLPFIQKSPVQKVLTESQNDNVILAGTEFLAEQMQKPEIPMDKKKEQNFNSAKLSQMQDKSNNIMVSTPTFIRIAPKRYSDLETTSTGSTNNATHISTPNFNISQNETEILDAKGNQCCNSTMEIVSEEPSKADISFISPKVLPLQSTLHTSPHSKRELFSPKDKPSDFSNSNSMEKVTEIVIKEETIQDNNMSIDEQSLANSFLNMSVDDIEPKTDLNKATKKPILVVIDEVNEDTAESQKVATDELKSYHFPYISANNEENDDNNNNEWNYLKSLNTDEARYRVVRSVWKNMHVPDPDLNLSCYNFYHKTKKNLDCGNEIISDRKRRRDDGYMPEPSAKRCKIFNNVDFFTRTLNEAKRKVENNFRNDQNKLRNDFRKVDRLRGRFEEKMYQLEGVGGEVYAFHRFYKGLPNQTQHDQQNIEWEQLNVNRMYERFRQVYGWSGRAFLHRVPI